MYGKWHGQWHCDIVSALQVLSSIDTFLSYYRLAHASLVTRKKRTKFRDECTNFKLYERIELDASNERLSSSGISDDEGPSLETPNYILSPM